METGLRLSWLVSNSVLLAKIAIDFGYGAIQVGGSIGKERTAACNFSQPRQQCRGLVTTAMAFLPFQISWFDFYFRVKANNENLNVFFT